MTEDAIWIIGSVAYSLVGIRALWVTSDNEIRIGRSSAVLPLITCIFWPFIAAGLGLGILMGAGVGVFDSQSRFTDPRR